MHLVWSDSERFFGDHVPEHRLHSLSIFLPTGLAWWNLCNADFEWIAFRLQYCRVLGNDALLRAKGLR